MKISESVAVRTTGICEIIHGILKLQEPVVNIYS